LEIVNPQDTSIINEDRSSHSTSNNAAKNLNIERVASCVLLHHGSFSLEILKVARGEKEG
jgi:hypothetical protein